MNTTKIEWFASLRGLLVLLFFVSHLPLLADFSPNLAFIIGRIGVAGFFLIAGYLAVSSISRCTCKQYLFNRFLRIYPIFWLLLIFVYLLSAGQYSITDLAKNALLMSKSMIGASWMLPIMVFMYVYLCVVHKFHFNILRAFYVLLFGSLFLGLCRHITGMAFPTAFCLLSSLGLLCYMWKLSGKSLYSFRNSLILYEIALFVSA